MRRCITLSFIILPVLAASLFIGGCSRDGEQDAADRSDTNTSKGRIGMTCMDLTNPYFKLIANIMEKETARYGYRLTYVDGGNDPAKQNNQIADFAAQKVSAVFLNPVDSQSAGEGVKKTHKAGIPVFTFDVQVTDEEAAKLVTYHIGSDNYQGGRLAGESMMKITGDTGKIAVITFPEITSCQFRLKGFKDYLKENNSRLEIVAELPGHGNRDDAYSTAGELLQAHANIVGIFAVNDPSALGTYAAVAKAGRSDTIHIIGFDASPAGKQAVFEKKLYDSPQQFPRKIAKGTVDAFVKYLEGEKLPKETFIPCEHYRYEDSVNDPLRKEEKW